MKRNLPALISLIVAASGTAAGALETEHISSADARRASSSTARDIVWNTSFDKVKAEAARDHKPILWVHMLGNIDAYT
ncbi:MAG TPA: hypothetical protein V6D17_04970 [Candidatus Obscuribacterales bacterium]